jgi:hypothetical protein
VIEIRTADAAKIGLVLELSKEFGLNVGIGSESCVHKLPSPGEVAEIASQVDDLAVVTPITPQKHYDWVLDFIRGLPRGVRLVVNDVGVLYSMDRDGLLDGFSAVVAGRGIVHTSEACPWVDHLLRDESEEVKDAFLQTNLNYSRTLGFFKDMGITALETDLELRTVEAALRTGLPVAGHAEFIAVSYARSCHTARFFGEVPPGCRDRCNGPMELELVDMFDLSGSPPGFAQPSPEMLGIFPKLYLLGATIFMKRDVHDVQGMERVIVNGDMYDPANLRDVVMAFDEGMGKSG